MENRVPFLRTRNSHPVIYRMGFPGGSVVKKSTYQCRRCGFNPGSGRSSGEGKWQPTLVCLEPCLENSMDGRAWQATVHEVTEVKHRLVTRQQQFTEFDGERCGVSMDATWVLVGEPSPLHPEFQKGLTQTLHFPALNSSIPCMLVSISLPLL